MEREEEWTCSTRLPWAKEQIVEGGRVWRRGTEVGIQSQVIHVHVIFKVPHKHLRLALYTHTPTCTHITGAIRDQDVRDGKEDVMRRASGSQEHSLELDQNVIDGGKEVMKSTNGSQDHSLELVATFTDCRR